MRAKFLANIFVIDNTDSEKYKLRQRALWTFPVFRLVSDLFVSLFLRVLDEWKFFPKFEKKKKSSFDHIWS
jgi:hypothetical protein